MGMTKAELGAELDRKMEQLNQSCTTIAALSQEIRALKNRASVEVQSGAEWRGQAIAYKEAFGRLALYLTEAIGN